MKVAKKKLKAMNQWSIFFCKGKRPPFAFFFGLKDLQTSCFFFTKKWTPSFPHRGTHLNDQIIRNDSKSFHTQAEPHWKRNPRNNPRFVWLFSGLKLGGLLRSASWGKWGHFHLRCCHHWILQNQMLSNKLGLNKDPEPPVTIWIEAATSLLKDKTASLQHQQISIGDHNMTTSQSQTEAECIIIGEFIQKKTHFKWKNSDFFTYSCANEAAYLQMPGIWLHGKKRKTNMLAFPHFTT